MVRTSTISVSPAETIAPIATASAQVPSGNEAFSTLQPAYTAPERARTAAPTRKCEYGHVGVGLDGPGGGEQVVGGIGASIGASVRRAARAHRPAAGP